MPTRADPPPPGLDEIDTIQTNGGDRGSASRCLANDHVPLRAPAEMIWPDLSPRVEEAHDLSCERVGSNYPIALVIVAHRAGEPEVLLDGEPAQRLGDDMWSISIRVPVTRAEVRQ